MRNRYWHACLTFVLMILPVSLSAQKLDVRLDGSQLRVTAPNFNFLTGEALKRLHDGASVTFLFQAGVSTTRYGTVRNTAMHRFVVSYDLWEEKYAVTRTAADSRSISHLSLSAAEKWCLDSLALPIAGLPADSFWVTVEYRVEDTQTSVDSSDNSRFTLSGLIDIFSERPDKQRSTGRKEITGGPFRLPDLRKTR